MKRLLVQLGVLGVLSAIAGAGSYLFHPDRPELYFEDEPLAEGEVSLAVIQERWGIDGVLWIDARMRDKFEAGHVAGAVLLNEQEWDDLLFQGAAEVIFEAATERPLVVYCGSLACESSRKVAKRLNEEVGAPEVYSLRGGWRVLRDAGLSAGEN